MAGWTVAPPQRLQPAGPRRLPLPPEASLSPLLTRRARSVPQASAQHPRPRGLPGARPAAGAASDATHRGPCVLAHPTDRLTVRRTSAQSLLGLLSWVGRGLQGAETSSFPASFRSDSEPRPWEKPPTGAQSQVQVCPGRRNAPDNGLKASTREGLYISSHSWRS